MLLCWILFVFCLFVFKSAVGQQDPDVNYIFNCLGTSRNVRDKIRSLE